MASFGNARPRKMRRLHARKQFALPSPPLNPGPLPTSPASLDIYRSSLDRRQATIPASALSTVSPLLSTTPSSREKPSYRPKPSKSHPSEGSLPLSATGIADVRAGGGKGPGLGAGTGAAALGAGPPGTFNALTMPGRDMVVKPWGLFVMSGVIFMILMVYFVGFILARSFRSDFRRRLASQKSQQLAITPFSPPPLSPPVVRTGLRSSPVVSVNIPKAALDMAPPPPPPLTPSGLLAPPSLLAAQTRDSIVVADGELDPSASGLSAGGGGRTLRFMGIGVGGGSKSSMDLDMVAGGSGGHKRTMSHPHSHHRSTSASMPSPLRAVAGPSTFTPAPGPSSLTAGPSGFFASRHLKRGSTALARVPAKLTTRAASIHVPGTGGHAPGPGAIRMQNLEQDGDADLWGGSYEEEAAKDSDADSRRGPLSPRRLRKALPGRSHLSSFGANPSRRAPPAPLPGFHTRNGQDFLHRDPYAAENISTPGLTSASGSTVSYTTSAGGIPTPSSTVLRSPRSPPLTDVAYRGANPWLAPSEGKNDEEENVLAVSGPLGLVPGAKNTSVSGVAGPQRSGVRRQNTVARAPMMGTMSSGGARESSFFPPPKSKA